MTSYILFICLLFPFQTRIFHSYGDVTIALTNPWHSAVADRLTVELSSPVLSRMGFEQPTVRIRGERATTAAVTTNQRDDQY